MSGETFTITAPPSTDIWRKPPSTDSFNAPTRALLPNTIPLRSFLRARVTLSAPWTTRYDQGGLLLHLKHPAHAADPDRWLKTGVEFYQGRVFLSTVATQTYSDWSIAPPSSPDSVPDASNPTKVTIEVRREGDELGTSLWVYEIVQGAAGEERRPLREVAWFFADEDGWEVAVSAMAARPASRESVQGGTEGLVVRFEGVEVDVA